MSKARIAAGILTMSVAAFVTLLGEEGYVEKAMVPTKNDRPTVGFGSTFHADGAPVKMGDKITPVRAVQTAAAHIAKEEQVFRESLGNTPLYQAEYDLYLNFSYQFGSATWRNSSMLRELKAGRYPQACDALLKYRWAGGRDCALPSSWGPGGCKGVWLRQQERAAACHAAGAQ